MQTFVRRCATLFFLTYSLFLVHCGFTLIAVESQSAAGAEESEMTSVLGLALAGGSSGGSSVMAKAYHLHLPKQTGQPS